MSAVEVCAAHGGTRMKDAPARCTLHDYESHCSFLPWPTGLPEPREASGEQLCEACGALLLPIDEQHDCPASGKRVRYSPVTKEWIST